MSTLGDLWRAVFPTAVRLGDAASEERRVAWVRLLKPRVPAFDGLETDDLAILPGAALDALLAGPVEPAALVETLAAAPAAGLLLVAEREPERGARQVVEGAVARRLGAFLVREADAVTLERSVIRYLVNARAELERQAARLEAQLERLALEGGELESHVAAVAAFLGRAVAIEGPRGEVLAVHVPAGLPAAAPAASRFLGKPGRAALRTPLPARARPAGGRAHGDGAGERGQERRAAHPRVSPAGTLVLLGPEPATELERVASERIAALLALELGRQRTASPRDASTSAEPLPSDGPPWVAVCARQLVGSAATSAEERDRLREELRRLLPARRAALRGDASSVDVRLIVAADADDPLGLLAAERIRSVLERPVAVSRPFADPEERPLAEAEARATLEAAETLGEAGEDVPRLARADRVAAYRLLASLHHVPDGLRHARALLAPLLVGREALQAERLATLRAVLEQPGLAEAAASLGVHRNTVAYRVGRIEAATGWSLEDDDLRFILLVAARLVQTDLNRVERGAAFAAPAIADSG